MIHVIFFLATQVVSYGDILLSYLKAIKVRC